jgi:flagellar FliJ protein
MARFRFRLQTLRRLREMNRDELRVRLAEAFQAEQILSQQREALAAEAAALAATRRQLMNDGSMDVTRLLESQRYQLLLEAQGRTLADQAARLAEEVDVRRQAVVEADRQVRVLDKLRERREQQHLVAQQAAEAKRLDEIATTRWEAAKR